jgi:hypothetical protein
VDNQCDQKKENESRVIAFYDTLPKVEQDVHVEKFVGHISDEPGNTVHLSGDACRLKNFGDDRGMVTEQNFD